MQEILERLLASAHAVIAASREAGPRPDTEWPAHVVLGHLADVDVEVWRARVALMLGAQRAGLEPPSLAWWEPDAEQTRAHYTSWTLDETAATFLDGRRLLIADVQDLTDAELDASARHATYGIIDIRELLRIALRHDVEHAQSLTD